MDYIIKEIIESLSDADLKGYLMRFKRTRKKFIPMGLIGLVKMVERKETVKLLEAEVASRTSKMLQKSN